MREIRYLENMRQDEVGAEGKTKEGDTEFQYVDPCEGGQFELRGSSDPCLFFPTVGEPLPIPRIKRPNKKTVDKYHTLYISALRKLFDEHKVQYGLSETQELTVI